MRLLHSMFAAALAGTASAQVPCSVLDLNGDGNLIPADYAPGLITCINFGSSNCDLDGDGDEDNVDVAFFIANFPECSTGSVNTPFTLPVFETTDRLRAVDISDAADLAAGYREYEIRFQLPSPDAELIMVTHSSFGCDSQSPPCFVDPGPPDPFFVYGPHDAATVISQGTIADTYVTIGDRTGDEGPLLPFFSLLDFDLFDAGESIQTENLGWHLDLFRVIGSPDSPGLGSADGNINNAVLILGIAQTAPRLSGTFDVAYTTPDGQLIINSSSITTLLCPADTNADGMLTPADFNAWIIAFNTQSPACDQNNDGLCTPADFNAWILNFNSGCP